MAQSIAIVGMACRYPDAAHPTELWRNVLAQRRAFRRIPRERLSISDYFSDDPQAPDRTYCTTAAVLENWEFDRQRYRIPLDTFLSVDPAHWLALESADNALTDAGFQEGDGLNRESTAVYVGNTLAGEFSRASLMRLRWPFVRRMVASTAAKHGMPEMAADAFLDELESAYKEPFHPVTAETLAGGLSNTIAGRIANHFQLNGGAFAIDGACASSLLAIANGCSALDAGDVDTVLAGGVDLSLDPFELVGFAKTNALARNQMRVYDERSSGFWPGEGCGFVVLMRAEEALAEGRRIYALIRGWGISSDGGGGITRPEVRGQLLALRRAYARAGFPIDTVGYFEGHGTGTSVGDETEIASLSQARSGAPAPAVIGSIKACIGHTKAAAGAAGFIKASMAVYSQVLPPMPACEQPRASLSPALRTLNRPQIWTAGVPLRAGVSSMGFGGINAHLVLESVQSERRKALSARETQLAESAQEAELFVFTGSEQMKEVRRLAPSLSLCELTDLAAHIACEAGGAARRAVVAASPQELEHQLGLDENAAGFMDELHHDATPRIGFLFPGQGSQNSSAATAIAQREIIRESLLALTELNRLGITAQLAIGHSLGEIAALCWAGAIDESAALRIAEFRGRAMGNVPGPTGAMAAIELPAERVQATLNGGPLVIAGFNAASQTVLSGPLTALQNAVARFRAAGTTASLLPVSHAFHSPAMAPAAAELQAFLQNERFQVPKRMLISTVTGMPVSAETDVRDLLFRQVEAPVRFQQALVSVASEIDLWIEVGPGGVLGDLVRRLTNRKAVSMRWREGRKRGLLETVAAIINSGIRVQATALFENRFVKPLPLSHRFLASPCESAPLLARTQPAVTILKPSLSDKPSVSVPGIPAAGSPAEIVRKLIAVRTQLPEGSIRDEMRLLHDLHLNSITVGAIASEAARSFGFAPPVAPTEYATSNVAEFTRAICNPANQSPPSPLPAAGVDQWVHTFSVQLVPRDRAAEAPRNIGGEWQLFGASSFPLPENWRETLLRQIPCGGVLLLVPDHPEPADIACMLAASKAALQPAVQIFAVLQSHAGAGALARTTFLEGDDLSVCVVTAPRGDTRAFEYLTAECKSVHGYVEASYDAAGARYERILSLAEGQPGAYPFSSSDVLLVSGGGKGIASECALKVARRSGASLVILGRSDPAEDQDLAANLERLRLAQARLLYLRANVSDAEAVRLAVCEAERTFGPVTAILHGAGRNEPRLIKDSSTETFLETLKPKVDGLRNLLNACRPEAIRLLVAFGSVIAETGMRGEADYGLANEWLSIEVRKWAALHPHCKSLTLEWSVWSGAGMGERLGRIDALAHQGISAIPVDEGVAIFEEAISRSFDHSDVIITGRFGATPTLRLGNPTLPLLRFLERPLVFYPGIELVAESEVNSGNDPYILDHLLDGEAVFPAVMGLEAMAQAAMAVTGSDRAPQFEDVRFIRPVLIPEQRSVVIRLAALVDAQGGVLVSLRSSETAFQTDHFRSLCRFETPAAPRHMPLSASGPVPIDPERDLYPSLLFQSGRFQNISRYSKLTATSTEAWLSEPEHAPWFRSYLPSQLILGNAGLRDAAIHSLQASIPQERILPVSVGKIERYSSLEGGCVVLAAEQSHDAASITYVLHILREDGLRVETWHSLRLQRVGSSRAAGSWAPPLIEAAVNRCLVDANDNSATHVFVHSAAPDSLEVPAPIRHRTTLQRSQHRIDGKPLREHGYSSRAHRAGLDLQAESEGAVGCDLEVVSRRPPQLWADLLGRDGFSLAQQITGETGEALDTACTRVWCARECLKKAGARSEASLLLAASERPLAGAWAVALNCGAGFIYTLSTPLDSRGEALVVAVSTGVPRELPPQLERNIWPLDQN